MLFLVWPCLYVIANYYVIVLHHMWRGHGSFVAFVGALATIMVCLHKDETGISSACAWVMAGLQLVMLVPMLYILRWKELRVHQFWDIAEDCQFEFMVLGFWLVTFSVWVVVHTCLMLGFWLVYIGRAVVQTFAF